MGDSREMFANELRGDVPLAPPDSGVWDNERGDIDDGPRRCGDGGMGVVWLSRATSTKATLTLVSSTLILASRLELVLASVSMLLLLPT